ncbi:hypothetical protein Tco_0006628 [Tanacetum coccineum]
MVMNTSLVLQELLENAAPTFPFEATPLLSHIVIKAICLTSHLVTECYRNGPGCFLTPLDGWRVDYSPHSNLPQFIQLDCPIEPRSWDLQSVGLGTDIQKESQKRPNQARDGKDKVNPKPKSVKVKISLDLSRLATTLNRLERSIQIGINKWYQSLLRNSEERERKARTTLLMAIPEDHLAKFHKMTDAKEMWEAIKSRFSGNDESKKMFQSLLSQLKIHGACVSTEDAQSKSFHRSLPASWFQVSLIMRAKPGVDTLSFDDPLLQSKSKGNQESIRRDAGNTGYKAKDNGRRPGKQEEPKDLVTLDGEGVDWTGHAEDEQENFALMAYSNSGSNTEVTSCSKECVESYAKLKKLYDEQREQLGDASIEIQAYNQALKR